jgi:putative sporulation protein YtaF
LQILAILLFAIAVSADGFMVGIAYGVKKIRIPTSSLIVISFASALAVTVSMVCGKVLASFFPSSFAKMIGAAMLIIIGIYFLLQYGRQKISGIACAEEEPLWSLNVRSLGIIIHILKYPSTADFDSSGEISAREAFFLGTALAMDAFGAGIGMALAGFNILFTALGVGVLKFILVNAGLLVGRMVGNERTQGVSALISGCILMAVGISQFL